MLIVPARRPVIPDATRLGDLVLQQVGASRQCEEHGCMQDRATRTSASVPYTSPSIPPFDTSAGEASIEAGEVLDSSVRADWSRMRPLADWLFPPSR